MESQIAVNVAAEPHAGIRGKSGLATHVIGQPLLTRCGLRRPWSRVRASRAAIALYENHGEPDVHASLETFIENCEVVVSTMSNAADRVMAVAPLMQNLAADADQFLSAEHFRSDPEHYARNAIYLAPSGNLSLFALVWLPGQWTPVHDHGSWGVVGIVRGVLEERSYMSASGEITGDSGIRLKRGGVILLNPGSVSSFVPNPDHIHRTGVPRERETCVSLHLYGRNMNSFHVYNVEAGTRRLIDVPHHQSQ